MGRQRDRRKVVQEPQERVPEGKRVRDPRGAQKARRGLRRAVEQRPQAPVARLRDALRVVPFGAGGRLGGRTAGRGFTSEPRFRVQASGPLQLLYE